MPARTAPATLITLLGFCMAGAALAQTQPPAPAAQPPAAKPDAAVQRVSAVQTAAAAGRAGTAPTRVLVQAAGSILVLSDGTITHAAIAPVATPAPGFVYER